MTPDILRQLLEQHRQGTVTTDSLVQAIQTAPTLDLGDAVLDLQREVRKGFPEVVYGAGKTPDQVLRIASALYAAHGRVLVTRITHDHAGAVRTAYPHAVHHEIARCLTLSSPASNNPASTRNNRGTIAVICAGTSDLPVAEEAAVTAEFLGNPVQRFTDLGVAGLHRLLARLPELQTAQVIICVAGMEGALPSVLGGLLGQPLIGVPTSVGYGSHFQGLTPLLAMLNSCSSGLTVVNIDNGFGAACAAHAINRRCCSRPTTPLDQADPDTPASQ